MQARRQDSVTRRAEINFGGAREVYLRRGPIMALGKYFKNSVNYF